MSALIKRHASAAQDASIRDISAPGAPPGPRAFEPQRPTPTFEEHQALEDELERLLLERDEANAQRPKEVEEARRIARAEALRELTDLEEKRIDALRESFAESLALWRQKLEETELLALSLAHTALDRLFSDPNQRMPLIKSAIERQLAELKRDSIISIGVSPQDFSENALRAFAAQFSGALRFTLDPELATESARIDMRLGRLDISLAQHRDALNALWRRLADGGAE